MLRTTLLFVVFSFVSACSPPTPKCTGCVSGGSCVSDIISASSAQTCGLGGNMCVACALSQTCTAGTCVTSSNGGGAGGGGGSMGGGGGTTDAGTDGGIDAGVDAGLPTPTWHDVPS